MNGVDGGVQGKGSTRLFSEYQVGAAPGLPSKANSTGFFTAVFFQRGFSQLLLVLGEGALEGEDADEAGFGCGCVGLGHGKRLWGVEHSFVPLTFWSVAEKGRNEDGATTDGTNQNVALSSHLGFSRLGPSFPPRVTSPEDEVVMHRPHPACRCVGTGEVRRGGGGGDTGERM